MSKNNAFWLVCGMIIGAFAIWCWTERQRVSMALADHGQRLTVLEFQQHQRAITDTHEKSDLKWWAGSFAFGLAALKFLAFAMPLVFKHIKF